MSFAECLQELREDRDISRKDLAAALNISISALGMYEQGRREPNIDMLIKIADFFNVSIDFLVGRTFNDKNNELLLDALHLKNKIDKLPQDYKALIDFMLKSQ